MNYTDIYKALVAKGVIIEDTPESFERFKKQMNTDSSFKARALKLYSPDDNTNQSTEGEAGRYGIKITDFLSFMNRMIDKLKFN